VSPNLVQLRKIAKTFRQTIDNDEVMTVKLNMYLPGEGGDATQKEGLNPTIKAYRLVTWILESRPASHGFGFPFDRVHFDIYNRLRQAYPTLKELKPLVKTRMFAFGTATQGHRRQSA